MHASLWQHLAIRPCQLCMRRQYRTVAVLRAPDSARKSQRPEHNYQTNSAYNYLVDEDKAAVFDTFPTVTAKSLAHHTHQPKRIKMLARDFIDDSLYNPQYGYFSKQAIILQAGGPQGFEFGSFRDNAAFQAALSDKYAEFEEAESAPPSTASAGQRLNRLRGEAPKQVRQPPSSPRQVWQTPTEMFKPFYGQAVARYLLTQYKLTHFPYRDLVLYEMGAGNGTLMINILDYLRDNEPEVYERTRYKIIEISTQLAKRQKTSLLHQTAEKQGHGDKVEIINKSIFDWDTVVPEPCFFLAMEVFDNFAHDAIRYDLLTGQPYQALVAVDEAGDFHELLSPNIDPHARRYLRLRDKSSRASATHPSLKVPLKLRQLRAMLPLAPNLTSPEFIPTRLMQFLDILLAKFPQHRLLASDFSSLPDAMEGVIAPVVQTRYKGSMVPCSTYMVLPGYFDIMFPTRWEEMNAMYSELSGAQSSRGYFHHVTHQQPRLAGAAGLKGKVYTHAAFLEDWGDVEATTTQSGENPMLDFYQNAAFFAS
ncbi:S-adenosyl-L-methionine-dependent methyltransferase [Protomyces lactucae-debilis]|uniref:Protein arginine methyltransferase NDUFAF7 n=1 Tax=Protomyces lactucae-debilis TaxID=2754530 RepID=A0A1Y2F8Z2_PROLT|nr:S-adenosyl-L-methionine-dependent methyltransferase [Protomyces lactucae-debilis]ORY80359.1 S-adenosyl-L-methionine-dependent methyltransferase [Protomyces lactucae-debilis]